MVLLVSLSVSSHRFDCLGSCYFLLCSLWRRFQLAGKTHDWGVCADMSSCNTETRHVLYPSHAFALQTTISFFLSVQPRQRIQSSSSLNDLGHDLPVRRRYTFRLFYIAQFYHQSRFFFAAILVYRVFPNVSKIKVKIVHAILLAASLICASIGLKAVFDSHNLGNPPEVNLYSLHSWIGLGTVILFGLQWVFGFIAFLYPKLSEDVRGLYMPRYIRQ